MTTRTVLALVIAIAVSGCTSCTSGPAATDTKSYDQQILAWRAEKDASFKSAKDSPIPSDKRSTFTGLSYYAIDPQYHVPAYLKEDRSGPPVFIQLQTSTLQKRRMKRVGTLGFTLSGTPYQLTAFADADTMTVTRLFVPFTDLTSNVETYGGGRYLDLDRTPTGLYDLDFNRAYHPFCLYNYEYECPLPPRENKLEIAVRAGEKLAR